MSDEQDNIQSIAATASYFDQLLARIPAAAYYSADERRGERMGKVKTGAPLLKERVKRTKKLDPDHRVFSARDFQQYLQSASRKTQIADANSREHYKVARAKKTAEKKLFKQQDEVVAEGGERIFNFGPNDTNNSNTRKRKHDDTTADNNDESSDDEDDDSSSNNEEEESSSSTNSSNNEDNFDESSEEEDDDDEDDEESSDDNDDNSDSSNNSDGESNESSSSSNSNSNKPTDSNIATKPSQHQPVLVLHPNAKPDRNVLRQRLQSIIANKRAERKAERHVKVKREPKEVRKRRQQQRQNRKKAKRETNDKKDSKTNANDVTQPTTDASGKASLRFGAFDFSGPTASRVDYTGSRNPVRRDKSKELAKAEAQASLLRSLQNTDNPDNNIKATIEKQRWSNALKRAKGVKVHDDPKRLKKAIKRREKKKQKSRAEWKDRVAIVEKGKAMKDKLRETRLRERAQAKMERRKRGRGAKPKPVKPKPRPNNNGKAGKDRSNKRRKTK